MTGREKTYPVILAAVLIVAVMLSAGCTGTVARPPQPTPVGTVQPGQVLQSMGDVTGQGVMLPGVPRVVIDAVTFTIGLAPGTKTIDLENITIIYADAVRTQTLTPVEGFRGNPPDGAWGIITVANEAGKPNNRLEFDELATIRISPVAAMVPGQLITIVVKPKEGTALTIRRTIPSTIMQGDNILPVA